MQAKNILLKISTLNFIYLVLIFGDRLSKISDTSQMMQESYLVCIMLLTTSNVFYFDTKLSTIKKNKGGRRPSTENLMNIKLHYQMRKKKPTEIRKRNKRHTTQKGRNRTVPIYRKTMTTPNAGKNAKNQNC